MSAPPPAGRSASREYSSRGSARTAEGPRRLIDYPRQNRSGVLRWIPSWKFTGTVIVTIVALMVATLLTAYAMTSVPPPMSATEAQATTVYYSDGSPLTRFSQREGNRTIVDVSKIPQHVQWAVIAAEDKTFYSNKGVSVMGLARAVWKNISGGDTQGGSTITQQYVKNSRVGSERSVSRKIKEFFIAIKISNQAPNKGKILTDYLNTIYFGRNAYGIQMAAQAYFDKSVDKLTLPEGVYLATIIQRPEYFSNIDPKNPAEVAELQFRYDYVLNTMVELGKLTPEQRASAELKTPPKPNKIVNKKHRADDQTVYLEQMVVDELSRNGMNMSEVIRSGWKIYTTFDRKLIDAAVKAVQDKSIGMGPRSSWTPGTQVGLVSIDPTTGKVRAIYGGDGTRSQSAASQDMPQAGSTYKVFTLVAALEGESKNGSDGISLRSRYDSRSPYTYKEGSVSSGSNKVTNYGNEGGGMSDLVKSTAHSYNTVYAQLNEEIGKGTGSRTRDVALRAGLPKKAIGNEVSNSLGNGTPRVVDLANAYATIAAEGTYRPYYVIEKIVSPLGAVIYPQGEREAKKQFSKDVMADTTYALQQVVKSGTAKYAARVGRPVAGKTGTVGTTGRATKAAWFAGYTPQLTTVVAMHRVGADGMSADIVKGWGPYKGKDLTGGDFPVRIWTKFMQSALEGQPKIDFPERADVGVPNNPEPVASPSPEGENGTGPDGTEPTPGGEGPGQSPDGENGDGQNPDGANGDQNGGNDPAKTQGDGNGETQGDGNGETPGDGNGGGNDSNNEGNNSNNSTLRPGVQGTAGNDQ